MASIVSNSNTARDLTLEAAQSLSAARPGRSRTTPFAQLKKLLDSRHEREILEGLRKVISVCHAAPPTGIPSDMF